MAPNFQQIMKQAQQMQAKMMRLQEELAAMTVEASSGGGMVTAVVNGKHELVSLKIEKDVVNADDIEMLQDLIVAAVNEAMVTSQTHAAERLNQNPAAQRLQGLVGGLNIPGM